MSQIAISTVSKRHSCAYGRCARETDGQTASDCSPAAARFSCWCPLLRYVCRAQPACCLFRLLLLHAAHGRPHKPREYYAPCMLRLVCRQSSNLSFSAGGSCGNVRAFKSNQEQRQNWPGSRVRSFRFFRLAGAGQERPPIRPVKTRRPVGPTAAPDVCSTPVKERECGRVTTPRG
jgi:hypothetical protein